MTTERLLVLDANILMRGVLGVRVRSLLIDHSPGVAFLTPSCCVEEVRKHLPALCEKRDLETQPTLEVLDTLLTVVRAVDEGFYSEFEVDAKRRVSGRDIDDWPVVALALAAQAPVWTEDRDFFGSGVAIWTARTVELYLKDKLREVHDSPRKWNSARVVTRGVSSGWESPYPHARWASLRTLDQIATPYC